VHEGKVPYCKAPGGDCGDCIEYGVVDVLVAHNVNQGDCDQDHGSIEEELLIKKRLPELSGKELAVEEDVGCACKKDRGKRKLLVIGKGVGIEREEAAARDSRKG
jgi:hypothetical protein